MDEKRLSPSGGSGSPASPIGTMAPSTLPRNGETKKEYDLPPANSAIGPPGMAYAPFYDQPAPSASNGFYMRSQQQQYVYGEPTEWPPMMRPHPLPGPPYMHHQLPSMPFPEGHTLPPSDPFMGANNYSASYIQYRNSQRSVRYPDPFSSYQPTPWDKNESGGYVNSSQEPEAEHHMESFPPDKCLDFKHVIYNMLVDNYNNPKKYTFVQQYTIKENGAIRSGFQFNEKEKPEKRLPELYAKHIRKADLNLEDQQSVFIQDLYKFYLRACVELLSKYFEKRDRYTYLYEDVPLFVPNGSLEEAEDRIKTMRTRSRKKKRANS